MDLITELTAALEASPDARTQKVEALWSALDPSDHAARCVAAHYIADIQADVATEVEWDELALRESINVSDADLQALHPTLTVAGLMPSLHLNLADGYRKLGRFDDAADRLATSREFDFALDAAGEQFTDYANMIRTAQERVAQQIAAGERD